MDEVLTLKRITQGDHTYGVLIWKNEPLGVTLELPWRNNQRNISCIPAGNYICSRYRSPTHGDCYFISDVPNRSHILIHAGNTLKDTQGCILVGRLFEKDAILRSRSALREMFIELPYDFRLEIKNV